MVATAFNRLLYIQQGLGGPLGHWLRETQEWRDASGKMGMRWHGLACRTLDSALAAACEVLPVFPYEANSLIKAPPSIAPLASFIELADVFAHICHQHLPADTCENDLLFVGFCREIEMFGTARFLDTLPPEKRPAVAMFFHHGDSAWRINPETINVGGDFSLWEYAARALALRLPMSKIRLYGANPPLAHILGTIFKIPVQPLGIVGQFPARPMPDYQTKPYDISTVGGARQEQGIDSWADILIALANLRPGLTASLHVNDAAQETMLRRRLAGHPVRADIVAGPLHGEAYERQLECGRLPLLPYQPERYSIRDSGVFSELTGRGIPSAVSDFTSMAYYVKSGHAAGTVLNPDPKSATALHAALNDIGGLYARAATLSTAWKNRHTATAALQKITADFHG